MPRHLRASRLATRSLAVAAAALCAGAAARAEESPYYVGASQTFTHSTNVFARTNAQGDTISTTSVFGGVDQALGRQHFSANGSVGANRYGTNSQLDYTSYGLLAALDLQTIERLSGNLNYSINQTLASYADPTAPILNIRNVQTTRMASGSARYGIAPELGLEGSLRQQSVDFSAVGDRRDYSQRVGSIGLRWGSSGSVSLGVAARWTEGDTPDYLDATTGATGDHLRRRDIDFTGTWQASGINSLSGRLSVTHETHSLARRSNLSGLTGALSWDYQPTAKTQLAVSLSNDTGAETTFLATRAQPNVALPADTDRRTTALAVTGTYQWTGRIGLHGSLHFARGSYDSVATNSTTGDTTNSVTFGATYAATRAISLSCNLSHETRASAGNLPRYGSTSTSCSGQITLR